MCRPTRSVPQPAVRRHGPSASARATPPWSTRPNPPPAVPANRLRRHAAAPPGGPLREHRGPVPTHRGATVRPPARRPGTPPRRVPGRRTDGRGPTRPRGHGVERARPVRPRSPHARRSAALWPQREPARPDAQPSRTAPQPPRRRASRRVRLPSSRGPGDVGGEAVASCPSNGWRAQKRPSPRSSRESSPRMGQTREPGHEDRVHCGAGDGIRTRDNELGKLGLYQLSYARPDSGLNHPYPPSKRSRARSRAATCAGLWSGT